MFCCSVSYRKVTNYSAMWRCSGWVNVIFGVVEGGGIRRLSRLNGWIVMSPRLPCGRPGFTITARLSALTGSVSAILAGER